jgi:hypothetical protein
MRIRNKTAAGQTRRPYLIFFIAFIVLGIFRLQKRDFSKENESRNQRIESLEAAPRRFAEAEARFESYRTRYQYVAPVARNGDLLDICGTGPTFEKWFQQTGKERSRVDEDARVFEYFFLNDTNNKQRTYLELGAFDGIQESNSRFFDECLGWEGLLVEANPHMYDQIRRNRPHAHRMFFAPSCNGHDARHNKTIRFHSSIHTSAGQADLVDSKDVTVEVPCGPLTPVVMDLFSPAVIDFILI